MMRLLLFFSLFFSAGQVFGQNYDFIVRGRALDAGVFDFDRIRREPLRVFYDDEADRQFEKLLERDPELRSIFVGESNALRESEAREYYPDHGVVLLTGGHGFISAYDVNLKKDVCGSPQFTFYSPSERYRLTGLLFDGIIEYCLEEKVDGKYHCLGSVHFVNHGSPRQCYWVDDETIRYLREIKRSDDTRYWIGYEGRIERNR
ncbi:MAG: hypothetical protein LIO85_09485 [Rikenellaceae bacterium]|nr:hypothetical protein [Rikenellaceae bacterium]